MPTNPFETLGVPVQFDLDEAQLHQRFIQAAAVVHPDRFIDPHEQADAAQQAADLNQAYATLQDPEARAHSLLELWGGLVQEDDKSLPPGFLMKVMETRERVEQAIDDGDSETLNELTQWARQQRQKLMEHVAKLFQNAQSLPQQDRQPTMKEIRLELNALRYFQRMIDQTSS